MGGRDTLTFRREAGLAQLRAPFHPPTPGAPRRALYPWRAPSECTLHSERGQAYQRSVPAPLFLLGATWLTRNCALYFTRPPRARQNAPFTRGEGLLCLFFPTHLASEVWSPPQLRASREHRLRVRPLRAKEETKPPARSLPRALREHSESARKPASLSAFREHGITRHPSFSRTASGAQGQTSRHLRPFTRLRWARRGLCPGG
jgi:hypothetical protein